MIKFADGEGSKNRSSKGGGTDSLGDVVAMIRHVEQERDAAVATLRKVRDMIDAAL